MPYQTLVRTRDGEEEILCPNCGEWQGRGDFNEFTIKPRYLHLLTPVLQCQRELADNRICRHIFAITSMALAMRQALLEGVEVIGDKSE